MGLAFYNYFEVCPSSHKLLLHICRHMVFFIPLSQVSFKTKILLCSCQATNRAGLGTSIVTQCKEEWGDSVIRLLMKGQKRSPLGMYFVDTCPGS